MEQAPVFKQRAANKPPPDYFWKDLQRTMHSRYPQGIDLAKGVCSTIVAPPVYKKNQSESQNYMKVAKQTKLFGSVTSPGEILGIKRIQILREIRHLDGKEFDIIDGYNSNSNSPSRLSSPKPTGNGSSTNVFATG